MALAVFDETVLPCMNLPFENVHSRSKKYLGKKALTGKVYATLSFTAINDAEMRALHDFWRIDCNYGTEPFVLPAPLFGKAVSAVNFIAIWYDDFKPTKVDIHWTLKIRVRILAPIIWVYDDAGNHVTNDNGDWIYTDESLHTSADNVIDYLQFSDFTI